MLFRVVFAFVVVGACITDGLVALVRSSAAERPNVLLVTIDTLRADRLGSYGYAAASTPVLDRLAAGGIRFTDATAHSPLTHPSHAAILTGRYPHRFGIRVNGAVPLPDESVTLAERLHGAGYRTAGFVASAVLERAYGLAQGFETYDDHFRQDPAGVITVVDLRRPAETMASAAGAWISAQRQGPWFAWVHFYDPHLPYAAPARFAALAKGQPYDAEIAYVDWALGVLLEQVDRQTTLVVVTADHGESLGDHGEDDHGYFVYDATLRVPLIVAGPGIGARTVTEQVRSVDIAPTIAAIAGLPAGEHDDGESLVPLFGGGSRREVPVSYAESWYPRLHFGWSELRAVRVGEWKYIAAPKPELYDLRVDPGEQRNIVGERGAVAGRLAADLKAIVREERAVPVATPDPEALRRLQALGYVGSFAPAASGGREDPKDRIADYRTYRRLFNRALTALHGGKPAEAVPIFKQILEANVRAFEAHLYLGNAYAALGQHEAALGELDAAGQLNPEMARSDFEAAKVFAVSGDVAGAIARARAGLHKEPRSFYGLYTLGVIHQKAGHAQEAFDLFTRAVAVNSREPRARGNLAQAAMQIGDLAVAREQLEQLIALGHQVAPSHYNLGLIALRAGARGEAERHFREALAADPKFDPARQALAKLK